ncbi:Uncharacterized protein AB751O23_AQ_00180 [Chlamydiales bacterium SCGC AB-751-O23]|jgi:glycine/D-amino acid oxidase-like deaminating enzyme|nr:Uncharacterized protein AB751O23_AQ_00180 [Chlamydiales bacterium SCGC AB-751-O23]
MKKIAIIGSGFAGLALSFYLTKEKQRDFDIDLFYDQDIDKSASGVSTGLLSPYSGMYATSVDDALLAFDELCSIVRILEEREQTNIFLSKGIFRLASEKRQMKAFEKRVRKSSDTSLVSSKDLKEKFPFLLKDYQGLYIEKAYSLNAPIYLKALHSFLKKEKGFNFVQKEVKDLSELREYESVFLAAGQGSLKFFSQEDIKEHGLNLVKGQVLEYEIPKEEQVFSQPLVTTKYLIPKEDENSLLLGATFEKEFESPKIGQSEELERLKLKGYDLFPPLKKLKVKEQRSAIRLCSSYHRPLWGRLNEKVYLLTSLGSKGLLFHALLAKELVKAFFAKEKPKKTLDSPLLWKP